MRLSLVCEDKRLVFKTFEVAFDWFFTLNKERVRNELKCLKNRLQLLCVWL